MRIIASKGGINSALNQPNRSKGETLLANTFLKNGYKIKTNIWDIVLGYEIDIFLTDFNIAISYNGPVHRIPIYGENRLRQIVQRDSYRNRKLLEMGIRHIVVEDEGHFSIKKVNKQYLWCLEKINDCLCIKKDPPRDSMSQATEAQRVEKMSVQVVNAFGCRYWT